MIVYKLHMKGWRGMRGHKLFNKVVSILLILTVTMCSFAANAEDGVNNTEWEDMNLDEKNKVIEKMIEDIADNGGVEYDEDLIYEVNELIESSNSIGLFEERSEEEIYKIISVLSMQSEELMRERSIAAVSADYNTKGGLITEPVVYLHNILGNSDIYTVSKSKYISGITKTKCTDWEGENNCTMTALANLMPYYRSIGYSKVFSSDYAVYMTIKSEASKLGYPNGGVEYYHIDNMVTNTWRNGFGYKTGEGNNDYIGLGSTAINEIDNNRPFLLSLAYEIYPNHTVMVFGYTVYKNTRTNKEYTFLAVADGWYQVTMYIPWENTEGKPVIKCLTRVIPPSSKTE